MAKSSNLTQAVLAIKHFSLEEAVISLAKEAEEMAGDRLLKTAPGDAGLRDRLVEYQTLTRYRLFLEAELNKKS